MKSRYLMSCAVSAVLSGFAGGTAYADPSTAVTTVESSGIEEIVVTADRRDETVEKTPMTIQALTGNELDALNVADVQDLLKYTPNVTYGNNGPGQGEIFMRGLSNGFRGDQSTGTVGLYPNVAIYLDEQSMQFPARNVDIYMVDMQRIEVLEGPQGTLFGGGAEAGALRYITNKPDVTQFSATAEGTYGVTSGGAPNSSFNVVMNLPIIDNKLAVRLVVYDDREGGYIDNVYSTFTRSDLDPGNVLLGIAPNGSGICPDGGHVGPAGCTLAGAPQANNSSIAGKNSNPVTHQGARFEALYDINSDWNVLIAESLQNLDAEGLSVEYPVGSDFQTLAPLQVTSFAPSYDKDDYANTALTVNGKVGDLSLIYTGGWTVRHINQQMEYTNYTRTYYGVYYSCTGGSTGFGPSGSTVRCYSPVTSWHDSVKNTHLSQEMRLSTPDNWRLRGIVGGYYEQFRVYDNMDFNYKTYPDCTQQNYDISQMAGGAPCVADVAPYPGSFANEPGVRGPNTAFGEDTQRGYNQTAFFGSVDFDIIPKVLTATAGTRWFQYNEFEVGSVYQTYTGCTDIAPVAPSSVGICPGKAHNDISANDDHATFAGFKSHLGLTWNIDDDNMAYYVFSQGFRPGGFNRRVKDVLNLGSGTDPQYATPNSFSPDSLTNQEVGIKSELLDHHLQLNLSVYDMQWRNVQFLLFQPLYTGNQTFATNGPGYSIKGAELQFVGQPMDGLTFQGSATYNNNTENSAPCLVGNIAGSATQGKCIVSVNGGTDNYPDPFGQQGGQAAFSPKWQGNLRGRYDWIFYNYNAFATAGVSYTGGMWNQPANYVSGNGILVPTTTYLRYFQPAYTTFDASLGITKDKWTASIFGENLGNSHASTFTSSAQWIKSEVPLRPRVMGVKLSFSY